MHRQLNLKNAAIFFTKDKSWMEKLIKSECGDACLQSQHSESGGKELANLVYTVRFSLTNKTRKN